MAKKKSHCTFQVKKGDTLLTKKMIKQLGLIPLNIKISTPFGNRNLTVIEIQEKELCDNEFKPPERQLTLESMNS